VGAIKDYLAMEYEMITLKIPKAGIKNKRAKDGWSRDYMIGLLIFV